MFELISNEIACARRIFQIIDEADIGLIIDGKLIWKPVQREMQGTVAIADRMGAIYWDWCCGTSCSMPPQKEAATGAGIPSRRYASMTTLPTASPLTSRS